MNEIVVACPGSLARERASRQVTWSLSTKPAQARVRLTGAGRPGRGARPKARPTLVTGSQVMIQLSDAMSTIDPLLKEREDDVSLTGLVEADRATHVQPARCSRVVTVM